MSANVGTGTSIVWGTSAFAAQLLDVSGSGESVESHRTSHTGLSDGDYHTYIPGKIIEGGKIRITFLYDPNLAVNIPTIGLKEVVTITFPDNDTLAASMINESWDWESPFEGLMMASMELQIAGDITRAVVA